MTDTFKVLLLGATGQVGAELRSALAGVGVLSAPGRLELDCAEPADASAAVLALSPDCVVNAVAYTRVDDAEHHRAAASLLNVALPRALAESCERIGASLVHFSSDYVFSGESERPYREEDPAAPLNWYGATKLDGERAAFNACSRVVVLRTSWIYGKRGHNFFRTMLRLAREREELRVVADQRGAPTWARAVAQGASAIMATLGAERNEWRQRAGVYHLTAGGETTWYDFAERLLSLDPRRDEHVVRRITPVASSEFPSPARRPRNSVLDCGLAARTFGVRLPDWTEQLDEVWRS